MIFECGFLEARKSPATSWIGSVRCGEKGSQLPDRYRPFEDASGIWLAIYADRREHFWLAEQIRMIAHGELGERPCALEAEHACADPPKRESDVVEIFTSINLIESTFV